MDQIFFVTYAIVLPFVIVAVRDQIRRTRLKITTEISAYVGDGFPSLRAVLKKYNYGPYPDDADLGQEGQRSQIAYTSKEAARAYGQETLSLLACGFVYSIVTGVGWALVVFGGMTSAACPDQATFLSTCSALWRAAAIVDPSTAADRTFVAQTGAIAAFAFLGAYVFTIRYLVRALMNYEVTPLALIRSTTHVMIGVIVALVVWHSAVNLLPTSINLLSGRLWLAVAFFIGFVPEYAVNTLGRQLDMSFTGLGSRKVPRGETGAVPLEILDGIDMWTRFRLEEARIEDVQNLATCNPIELYVDTPFGFFEVMDWVLQAQLCTSVGPMAFLQLRKIHIRTIFDFERAVTPNE